MVKLERQGRAWGLPTRSDARPAGSLETERCALTPGKVEEGPEGPGEGQGPQRNLVP